MDALGWYISAFPEALYGCPANLLAEYGQRVVYGKNFIEDKTVIICGIARDLEQHLPYTLARVERLGDLFADYGCIFFENDSKDNTLGVLQKWAKGQKADILSEKLGNIKHEQDTSIERTTDMAYYRNKYLRKLQSYKSDYVIVIDMDLEGGWSYEGVCNSFSYDFDVMGSNSIIYTVDNDRRSILFYDAWAFRRINHESAHKTEDINVLKYDRGDSPFRTFSCFGGLAIYKRELLDDVWYESYDCDHPTLHKQLRQRGHTKILLNPSQITLYNRTDYASVPFL